MFAGLACLHTCTFALVGFYFTLHVSKSLILRTCVIPTHLSGRQGDGADQLLRKHRLNNMAFRRAPPGTPVSNPYDSQSDDATLGEDQELDGEGDEPPRHMGFPCAADIAQVYLFFNIPTYICFCTTCVLSTFIRPTGAWRQVCATQNAHRLP
jgi:hypothetical protein